MLFFVEIINYLHQYIKGDGYFTNLIFEGDWADIAFTWFILSMLILMLSIIWPLSLSVGFIIFIVRFLRYKNLMISNKSKAMEEHKIFIRIEKFLRKGKEK